jgi:hypothetical protein
MFFKGYAHKVIFYNVGKITCDEFLAISREYVVYSKSARLEVLTAVFIKIPGLWDMTPCRMVNSYRRFGGAFCPYFNI